MKPSKANHPTSGAGRTAGNQIQDHPKPYAKLTPTKELKEENNMFAQFATKIATRVVPRLIANPVLALELAPVILVAGAGVAIYDAVKNN